MGAAALMRSQGDVDLDALIRKIPNHPKDGILFYDLMPLLQSPAGLRSSVGRMAELARPLRPDLVMGAEARGFIAGGAMARELDVGFAAARKPGKLPAETISAEYDLEYGTDRLEVHRDAVRPGSRVLLHDDLLATGGTAEAQVKIVEELGGEVVGLIFIVELTFLPGRDRLGGVPIHSLVTYDSEAVPT